MAFIAPNLDIKQRLLQQMPLNVYERPMTTNMKIPTAIDQTTKLCPERWKHCGSTLYIVYPSLHQVCQFGVHLLSLLFHTFAYALCFTRDKQCAKQGQHTIT
jgi:hypothetical protein